MKRAVYAVLISLGVHATLALGLVAYFRVAPGPKALPTLDLSSVDLSFAEQEDASAPVVPQAPSAALPEPPKPTALEPPPPRQAEMPLPPEPEGARFPEPQEERPQVKTEDTRRETKDAPREPEDARRETTDTQRKQEDARRETQAATPTPAVAPRQARVDAPPKPRRTIRPVYPKGARQRGEQGEVTVEIEVDAEGRVSAVKVVGSSGFAELDDAAVRAVRAATFVPAKSGGRAMESSARLTLAFRLK